MCGIAGIFNHQSSKKIEQNQLKLLASSMMHRGPDEFGAYLDDSIGLVHSRLSIIDIENGIQPIHNEDKSIWVIFNGEIYNYIELKDDLVKKGHKFYTSTDTEVLIHLYEEKGEDFLNELNGQFAIAIWDSRKGELFLARDRLGI
ncbi:MAG: asparagine synthetase B, partial [Melioribacteraceae bacterium]|nr:asparagine synthetase B [Melioribacteraceae bacterium]